VCAGIVFDVPAAWPRKAEFVLLRNSAADEPRNQSLSQQTFQAVSVEGEAIVAASDLNSLLYNIRTLRRVLAKNVPSGLLEKKKKKNFMEFP